MTFHGTTLIAITELASYVSPLYASCTLPLFFFMKNGLDCFFGLFNTLVIYYKVDTN